MDILKICRGEALRLHFFFFFFTSYTSYRHLLSVCMLYVALAIAKLSQYARQNGEKRNIKSTTMSFLGYFHIQKPIQTKPNTHTTVTSYLTYWIRFVFEAASGSLRARSVPL